MVQRESVSDRAVAIAASVAAWLTAHIRHPLAEVYALLLSLTPVTKQKRLIRVEALGQRLDLVAVMLTVIIAGMVGYIGINIMNTTRDNTSLSANDAFFDSQDNLTQGLEDFFGQIGTVFTVIILVVIVSYLTLLRGR